MKNNIYIYVAPVCKFKDNDVLPEFAKQEIDKINYLNSINQKKAVWGLLHKAIEEVKGFDDDFYHIEKNENGKPISKKYFLSISHCEDLVAVAVSNENVGIDIERVDKNKNFNRLIRYISHPLEKLPSNTETLYGAWVKKEAKFKFEGGKTFFPKNINTSTFSSKVFSFNYQDDIYYLAIVADNLECVEIKNLTN